MSDHATEKNQMAPRDLHAELFEHYGQDGHLLSVSTGRPDPGPGERVAVRVWRTVGEARDAQPRACGAQYRDRNGDIDHCSWPAGHQGSCW